MDKVPYRQIHLDFHTSPLIDDVGSQFDKDLFIKTLKDARVNSINLFAKCHHGFFYYPTKLGEMHPALNFDLFGEQVKACKENGIRALAYTCVSWNEDCAEKHPDWLMLNTQGVLGLKTPFENAYYSWRNLCYNNSDYKALLKQEIKEVNDKYSPDGYWIDIVFGRECVCPTCVSQMIQNGLNPQNIEDVKRHDRITEMNFCREFYTFIKELDQNSEIYFNSLPYLMDLCDDKEVSAKTKRKYVTSLDIESLPSDMWGYTHFPIVTNYLNKYDQEITMMNGKFAMAWGDFGSLRNQKALEYECFRAIALGAKVGIGDQMHPVGRLEPAVYKRIGEIYKSIEEKEPWLLNTKKHCEVGVFAPTLSLKESDTTKNVEEGVYRILTELHIPFDFLDYEDEIDGYKLIILADLVPLTPEVAEKLDRYAGKGGKLLVTGRSSVQNDAFLLRSLGADYISASNNTPRYLRLNTEKFPNIPNMDHVAYLEGDTVKAKADSEILAYIVPSYFNRSYDKFCSHRQTPPKINASDEPAIIYNKKSIYISSPLFSDYAINGYKVFKDIISEAIDILLPEKMVECKLPSISEIMLRKRDEETILHVVSYIVERKNKTLDTIEEAYPLYQSPFKIKTLTQIKSVKLVPQNIEIPYDYKDGYVSFTIPFIDGHQIVSIY